MSRAVFLDRDGTLNAEVGFVRTADQLRILPGVAAALAALHDRGFRLVVVTNQSGIARGYYGEHDLAAVHERMHAATGGRIAGWLHCPHHPDADGPYGGDCTCRKPKNGLLHQARELLGVTFAGSYLVGDSARDLLMARDLPIATVHVHSGKPPAAEREALRAAGHVPTAEVADLPAAVAWILRREALATSPP